MSFASPKSVVFRGFLFSVCAMLLAGCGPRRKVESYDTSSQWTRVDYPKPTMPLSSELRILAWEEYIPQDIIDFFAEKYGVRLTFQYIDSNEELYQRLHEDDKPYDLVMPSSYMVQRLINENLLRPIDHAKIPRITDIDRIFFKWDHDHGLEYSVPLFFGSTGIALNVNYSSGLLLTWPEFSEMSRGPLVPGRMGFFAEMRTGMGMALIMLGHSPNSRNPEEISTARDLLLSAKERIGLQFVGHEIGDQLISNELIMAPVWSGDAAYALAENGFIRYIIPRGPSIMELDSLSIPANARHPETAEFFINFLLTPEVMAAMTNHSYFGNTSSRALAFVKREIRNGPSYMRPLLNDIVFLEDVEEATPLYEEAWAEVLNTPGPDIQKIPLPFDSPLQVGKPY